MSKSNPHILLVNPWIHDFAAYDFWAKPYGLLALAAILRQHDFKISYIDCQDRFHPLSPVNLGRHRSGRGPFIKTPVAKPAGLSDIPRRFCRYGIRPQWLHNDLKCIDPPDVILVTSMMTYWYPGVQETIRRIRIMFSNVPIVLGGIYATLYAEHAAACAGADEVFTGAAENGILQLVGKYTGHHPAPRYDPENDDSYPRPAFDLQHRINYIPLLTGRGCPFKCAYCASRHLNPTFKRRSPVSVVEEILYWRHQYKVVDFALYDDAFLVDAPAHAVPILEHIIRTGSHVRFHTPNALHVREITQTTADLMYRAGFKTVRLGLETAEFSRNSRLDAKVTADEFHRAVSCLRKAGFKRQQVGAYLLVGLPDQTLADIVTSIDIVKASGITPIPAYYSPIPHTALWPKAVASSRYDLEQDPIFTNNAVMPCQKSPFSWKFLTEIKRMAGT